MMNKLCIYIYIYIYENQSYIWEFLYFFTPNQTKMKKIKIFSIIQLFHLSIIFYFPTFSLLQPLKLLSQSYTYMIPVSIFIDCLSLTHFLQLTNKKQTCFLCNLIIKKCMLGYKFTFCRIWLCCDTNTTNIYTLMFAVHSASAII